MEKELAAWKQPYQFVYGCDAHMIGSVCRLFSGKPLSKPMLVCSLNHWDKKSVKFQSKNQNATIFSQEKLIWICRLQIGGHFVSAWCVLME